MFVYYYFFSAKGISDTEGEEKNWLENINAGMTISPGGLPPQNCCGALLLLLLLWKVGPQGGQSLGNGGSTTSNY